jgi:hypothetical protein
MRRFYFSFSVSIWPIYRIVEVVNLLTVWLIKLLTGYVFADITKIGALYIFLHNDSLCT